MPRVHDIASWLGKFTDLNVFRLADVSPGLIQKICRSKGMDRQTVSHIVLSRQESNEAIFKITEWCGSLNALRDIY
ncbi:hypothetical protein V6N12_036585 [Hibiscus sabdariffa]|uniref:Uncharacterized protein n=1 Tax=Hibiscus sabdariffa TaxID=183260 RepID=A0ABR2ER12_9ROSI